MITSNFYVLEENKIPHQSAKDVNGMLSRTFLVLERGGLEIVTSWTSLLNAFNVKRNKLVSGGGVGFYRGR